LLTLTAPEMTVLVGGNTEPDAARDLDGRRRVKTML